jgi:hypothetical protein
VLTGIRAASAVRSASAVSAVAFMVSVQLIRIPSALSALSALRHDAVCISVPRAQYLAVKKLVRFQSCFCLATTAKVSPVRRSWQSRRTPNCPCECLSVASWLSAVMCRVAAKDYNDILVRVRTHRLSPPGPGCECHPGCLQRQSCERTRTIRWKGTRAGSPSGAPGGSGCWSASVEFCRAGELLSAGSAA